MTRIAMKRNAVAFGVFLGVALSLMVIPSRHASATIAVFDQANVAKTIEIVNNTITQIQQMYSQIQLLETAIKNMDAQSALRILQQLDEQQAALTYGHKQLEGLGKKDIETVGLWQERIGVAQDIMSGKASPGDMVDTLSKHHELIYDTTTDAARTAKAAQETNEKIAQNLEVAVEASNNAEGTKGAVQANTAVVVQNTQAIMQNTELLSQMVQMEAAKQGTQDYQKAAQAKMFDLVAQTNARYKDYENPNPHD